MEPPQTAAQTAESFIKVDELGIKGTYPLNVEGFARDHELFRQTVFIFHSLSEDVG